MRLKIDPNTDVEITVKCTSANYEIGSETKSFPNFPPVVETSKTCTGGECTINIAGNLTTFMLVVSALLIPGGEEEAAEFELSVRQGGELCQGVGNTKNPRVNRGRKADNPAKGKWTSQIFILTN